MKLLVGFCILVSFVCMAQTAREDLVKNQKKTSKATKRLTKRNKSFKEDPHLNGQILNSIIGDKSLSNESIQGKLKAEHEYLESCLQNKELSLLDRQWIINYQKIIDQIWTPYYISEGIYQVRETCSDVGELNYDIQIIRDASNPEQVIIKNFYNIGFNSSLILKQTNQALNTIKNIYDSSEIKISPDSEIYEKGNFYLHYSMNDGSQISDCKAYFYKK